MDRTCDMHSNYIDFFESLCVYSTSSTQKNVKDSVFFVNNKSYSLGCFRYVLFAFVTRFRSLMGMNNEFSVFRNSIRMHEVAKWEEGAHKLVASMEHVCKSVKQIFLKYTVEVLPISNSVVGIENAYSRKSRILCIQTFIAKFLTYICILCSSRKLYFSNC